MTRDQLRLRWTRAMTPRLSLLAGLRGTHDDDVDTDVARSSRARYATGDVGLQWRWQEEFSLRVAYDYTWQEFDDADQRRHVERRHDFVHLSTPATSPRKERLTMDSDINPEFSDYIHAIARRKALLFGVAIPDRGARDPAVGRAARHLHVVGAGGDRRAVEHRSRWPRPRGGE